MIFYFLYIDFIIFLCVCSRESNETIRINISKGELEGYVDRSTEFPVHIFKGVPFALPPTGDLRFALPKEKSKWNFTWDAKSYRAACMTNTTVATKVQKVISEDCLYMNIFADSRCTASDPCPVAYYIHGGDFFWGSAVQFSDEFIVERYASDRIIFLIPAYRLGIFGFWDIGSDEVVPRNLGLHDLIFSLGWVQNEIRYFGGDANRVTLIGNSAGASAIQFLSVSPALPNSYYSYTVISSGVPTMFNGFNHSATNSVIKQTGCSKNVTDPRNLTQIMECIKKMDGYKLLDMAQRAESEDNVFFNGIVSDSLLFNNKTFTELLLSNSWKAVPTFIGATKYEMSDHYKNISLLCHKYGFMFDYYGNKAIHACVKKYKSNVRQLVADATHAEVYREALIKGLL